MANLQYPELSSGLVRYSPLDGETLVPVRDKLRRIVALSDLGIATGTVAPSVVEAALARASAAGLPLVLDASFTLSGDVLVDEPVHIYQPPGYTITMGNSPTWDNGISAADDTRYLGAMFMFRTGADGSFFEAFGKLDVNEAQAGSVSGETVQPCAVALFGCHDVRIDGDCEVIRSFNAITVVDSDRARIDGVFMNGGDNAAVDAEGSDDGYVGKRVRAYNTEEGVDLQVSCVNWEINIAADSVSQSALEINNCQDVRANVSARNCPAVNLFNYADEDPAGAAYQRWTARGRAYSKNANFDITSTTTLDSSFTNTLQFIIHRLTHCIGYRLLGTVNVGSTNGRVSHFFQLNGNEDNKHGHIIANIVADDDTINNLTEVDLFLMQIGKLRDHVVEYAIVYPFDTGQGAIEVTDSDAGTIVCKHCSSRTNIGSNLTLAGSINQLRVEGVNNTMRLPDGDLLYDAGITPGSNTYFVPLIGSLANRPAIANMSNGQIYQDIVGGDGIYVADRSNSEWKTVAFTA